MDTKNMNIAPIIKLSDSTIQQIAAGEVITRPVNVVKELLENSLDAGATNVRITLDQGGYKLIEIIDNGHGIARSNADLLCSRYATSKLSTADDLTNISTFGFRGEALASVSEMADLEVKTLNMKADKMGWHARYKYGNLENEPVEKYLQNPGTQIKVTNLFSGIKSRLKTTQASVNEEKKSIIDMVTRYALHHREKVTMSLKELNSNDLVCIIAPMQTGPCIGMFFGLDYESNMTELPVVSTSPFEVTANVVFSYKKASCSFQQSIFILFVNNRLVESPVLKKEVEAVASEYLSMKNFISLFYIYLVVPPHDVDVNAHPSKATVVLHFQNEIIDLLVNNIKTRLDQDLKVQTIVTNSTQQRTIVELQQSSSQKENRLNLTPTAERRLAIMAPSSLSTLRHDSSQVNQTNSVYATPAKRPHDLIHNDHSQKTLGQTMDRFVPPRRPRRDLKLRSLNELRRLVISEKTKDPAQTIKKSVFVGIFDYGKALIQYETRLYVINLKAYLKEAYYQAYLFDFGNFPPIEILPPGNKISNFIDMHLIDLREHEPEEFLKLRYKTSMTVLQKLTKHTAMFEEYVSLKFNQDEIITIPCLMPNDVPNLLYLGRFFVDMANLVNFRDEKDCLRHIGRLLADFYSEAPANLRDETVHRAYHEAIESTHYNFIKNYLLIPEWLFTVDSICQISDTKDLYKVFERC